jgi:RNA polymerase sigma-70 factor (family 1)
LTLIAEGDEQAFNTIFSQYRDRLFQFLVRIVKSPDIAEEIITDVFMKLWLGKSLLAPINNLEGFLHKVAYNKAMNFFKVVSRHSRLQQVYLHRLPVDYEKNGEDLLIDAEHTALINEAVNQLPPQRQKIYRLSREEGLTYDEIAEALNLSANTVRNSMVASNKSISQYLRKQSSGSNNLTLVFFLS